MWDSLIFVFHVHKSDFHHKKCILIFSFCAHKFDFRHKKCIVILSCCAHKPVPRHTICILIFLFRVHTWFVVLTSPNILCNTLLIDFFCCFQNTQIIKSVCILYAVFFSIFISHQAHEKYKWSLKIK